MKQIIKKKILISLSQENAHKIAALTKHTTAWVCVLCLDRCVIGLRVIVMLGNKKKD